MAKGKKLWSVAALTLSILVLLAGCSGEKAEGTPAQEEIPTPTETPTPTPTVEVTPTPPLQSSRPAEGEPSDWFPTSAGTKWTYKIDVGEIEPLNYREVTWPLGNGRSITYSTRGRFRALLEDEARKTFVLEVRVKGSTTKQGPLEYPAGVELEIEKDELGIFEDAQQVFWAVAGSGRFMAHEVVTYSPDTPGAPTGAWGSWGQKEGYSMRLVFFAEKPGIEIGMGKEPRDTLLFTGVDTQVPQYEGIPLLHFLRTVQPAQKEEGETMSYLDKGFTEDTWFAKEKGLVRLEQKVDGKTSIVCTLPQFSK